MYSSVYLAWVQRLAQEVDNRLTNRALLRVGIVGAHSLQTGKLAACIAVPITTLSSVRRLDRFLDKGAVKVRSWDEPSARWLTQAASVRGALALVWDSTKVSAPHRLVLLGIADRQRLMALAWTWLRSSRGHCSTQLQLALLRDVRGVLPVHVRVSLVGDGEFGHRPLLITLQAWQWDYVLRQRAYELVDGASQRHWRRLDALIQRGQWPFLKDVYLTATHQVSSHLRLAWQRRYPTAWRLATNLTNTRLILRLYHRRMWLEETYGDLKDNGFDLDRSALEHFLRLWRLTLAVALVSGWFLAFGADQVQRGLGAAVDRPERRDLSLFRIAWDALQRALRFDLPFSVSFVPFFGSLPDFQPCGCSVSRD